MAEALTSLEIKVSHSSSDAVKSVDQLTKALSGLQKVLNNTGLDKLVKGLNELSNAASGVDNATLSRLNAIADSLGRFQGLDLSDVGKGVRELARGLNDFAKYGVAATATALEVQKMEEAAKDSKKNDLRNAIESSDGVYTLSGYAKVAKESGFQDTEAPASAKEAQGVADAMGKVSEKTSKATGEVKKLNGELTKGQKVAQAFGNALSTAVRGALKYYQALGKAMLGIAKVSIKPVISAFRKLGDSVKNTFSKVKKLFSSLARIALYRLMRTLIKSITSAFTDGIKNIALYSKAIGEIDSASANKTLSQLATIGLQTKNALGSLAAQVLTALLPAITTIANAFIRATNAITAFFAALRGKSTFSKAKEYAVDYADSLESASGAADEVKKSILGFDEINALNDNSDSGSSSEDYADMFEEASVGGLGDLAQQMKDLIDIGDWEGAGRLLADKLNSIIEAWDAEAAGKKLAEKLNHVLQFVHGFLDEFDWEQLGSKLAGFLNGLFEDLDWETLGKLWTDKWNAIFGTVKGFALAFDWSQFAAGLATATNSAIENLNADDFKDGANALLLGILDAIKEYFDDTDWLSLGAKFNEMLTGIKWYDIFYAAGAAATSIVDALKEAIADNLTFQNIGTSLAEALNGALDGLNVVSIAQGVNAIATDILNGIIAFVRTTEWNKLGTKIGETLKTIDWGYLLGKATGAALEIVVALVEALANMIADFEGWGDFATNFVEGISNSAKSINWKRFALDIAQLIVNAFLTIPGIAELDAWMEKVFGHSLGDLSDMIAEAAEESGDLISKEIDDVGDRWDTATSQIQTVTSSTFNTILKKVGNFDAKTLAAIDTLDLMGLTSDEVADKLVEIGVSAQDAATATTRAFASINSSANSTLSTVRQLKNEMASIQSIQGNVSADVTGGSSRTNYTGQQYASGGVVDTGSMFIARESGPELVGTIGNHTAVMNNDQIVSAVAQGVASAVGSVMSNKGSNGAVYVYLDGKQLTSTITKRQAQNSLARGV